MPRALELTTKFDGADADYTVTVGDSGVTVERPGLPTFSCDLDACLREQWESERLEAQFERGLRVPAGAR